MKEKSKDRVQWVYSSGSNEELSERYDEWAKDYDQDLFTKDHFGISVSLAEGRLAVGARKDDGQDENDNDEIINSGQVPNFDFKPKSHYELGENLGMLDFDLASKTTGSRFVFVKDKLASLERAISNYMIDTHTKINGYTEISPPLLASENTMLSLIHI